MKLTKLINGSNFRTYNIDIAKKVSVNSAIVLSWLSFLVEKHDNYEVFSPYENISDYTGLTNNEIKTALNKLQEANFITIERKGVPCKNYYTLQETYIFSFLKSNELDSEKVTNWNIEKCVTSSLENNALLKNSNKNSKMNNNKEELLKNSFEEFRKNYKGVKKGLDYEFANFIKKYPKTWEDIIPMLQPANEKLERYLRNKKESGGWVPEYKHLTTWINQAGWEDEFPELEGHKYITELSEDVINNIDMYKMIEADNDFFN